MNDPLTFQLTFAVCGCAALIIHAGSPLKLDQALLTFHNQLAEGVHVFYTSDFCYKVRNVLLSCLYCVEG